MSISVNAAPGAQSNGTSAAPLAPSPVLFRFSDVIGEVLSDARDAHEAHRTGQPRGPMTGLRGLDAKLNGALPPGPIIVLGNTGAGKTAFVTQIAASCQCPALLVTCEMAPAELFRRQMARVCGQFLGRFKSGEMEPGEVERMAARTAEAMPNLSLVDATRAYASPAYLQEVALREKGDARHFLLVIDSLHAWTRSAGIKAPEYEALNESVQAIQTLARNLRCPVLVVCEQSRASMEAGGVNSGAGTRAIEYGAEIVLDLQAGKDEASGEKPVTLSFAKNRHGAKDARVNLQFNGALQRFREVER